MPNTKIALPQAQTAPQDATTTMLRISRATSANIESLRALWRVKSKSAVVTFLTDLVLEAGLSPKELAALVVKEA